MSYYISTTYSYKKLKDFGLQLSRTNINTTTVVYKLIAVLEKNLLKMGQLKCTNMYLFLKIK